MLYFIANRFSINPPRGEAILFDVRFATSLMLFQFVHVDWETQFRAGILISERAHRTVRVGPTMHSSRAVVYITSNICR